MKWLKISTVISMLILFVFGIGWSSGCPEAAGVGDDFIINCPFVNQAGGTNVLNVTNTYHGTNGVNDNLFLQLGGVHYQMIDENVIIDSMFICIYAQAEPDSAHIIFQRAICGEVTDIDSVWWTDGATPAYIWSDNILQNGAYAVEDSATYRIYMDCFNDGAADIRVSLYIRILYHIE